MINAQRQPSGFTAETPPPWAADLLDGFSLEITGKDGSTLRELDGVVPGGTLINLTFLGNEEPDLRIAAAQGIRDHGFRAVPHVAARRIASERQLRDFLARLQDAGATERLFVVAGDPSRPAGPYEDSLALIRTGVLQEYGARHISIAGYPEGHPDISDEALWDSLVTKHAALTEQGTAVGLLTQFCFDTAPVLAWIAGVRQRGIDAPIRVGVPGPAGIRRLLSFAKRCGIGSSSGIARKYGFSVTNLLGTAGPDQFIDDLATELDGCDLGPVDLHFYTFGGLGAISEWLRGYREAG